MAVSQILLLKNKGGQVQNPKGLFKAPFICFYLPEPEGGKYNSGHRKDFIMFCYQINGETNKYEI
jgi:hypothetical protein